MIVVIAGLVIMFVTSLVKEKFSESRFMKGFDGRIAKLAVCYTLLVCVLIFANYGIGYNEAQFIYNRF